MAMFSVPIDMLGTVRLDQLWADLVRCGARYKTFQEGSHIEHVVVLEACEREVLLHHIVQILVMHLKHRFPLCTMRVLHVLERYQGAFCTACIARLRVSS